ncbi:MAG TPA: hypothetical protein VM492_10685 [Sumerlaeia bacterium]|nr:hypothetical protein [Sumerlaeia bacterium]
MTVLVGLYCTDGVVVGSDGSTTFLGAGNTRTIEQPSKKIHLIGESIILASTGSIGLNQRFTEAVGKAWENKHFWDLSAIDFGKKLSAIGINDFAETQTPKGDFGCLVAFPAMGKAHLCELAVTDFQPELKNEKIWYCSMGSGQAIADPFLGFMRRIFWTEGPPKLSEGVFAVVWTLSHTIDVNPGSINEPIQVAVLEHARGRLCARPVPDGELDEHRSAVGEAEESLRKWRDAIQESKPAELPRPPRGRR